MPPVLPDPINLTGRPRTHAGWLIAVWLMAPATALWAAPTSTDELAGSGVPLQAGKPSAGTPAGTVPPLPTATGQDQARTMELLLQLQDKSGAFASKDQANAASAPSLRRALAATAAGDAAAEGSGDLLGSMKKSMLGDGAAQGEARADSTSPMIPGTTAGTAGSPRASADAAEPRQSVLSNPVVRYIRENRLLVIGASLGLLAAVWLAAGLSMRRRR